MKTKTSITLSQDLLQDIDRRCSEFRSRSELIEMAVRSFLSDLVRREREMRDLCIINERADALNAEAEDALSYQAPL